MEIKTETKTYIETNSNERMAAKVLRKLITEMLETVPSEYGIIVAEDEFTVYSQDYLQKFIDFCSFIENNKVLHITEIL